MDFSLSEEQVLLRDSARDFLDQEWPLPELRRMLDAEEAPSAADAFWLKVGELGWPALLIDEDYDGLGLGLFDLAVLMEECGRRLIPGTLHASGILSALALGALGNPVAKEKYLPDIAEGRLKATVGVYEPGSVWTSMLLQPPTNGSVTKRYVPEAEGAGLILVLNRTAGNSVELAVAHEVDLVNLRSMDVTRPLFEVVCETDQLERIGELRAVRHGAMPGASAASNQAPSLRDRRMTRYNFPHEWVEHQGPLISILSSHRMLHIRGTLLSSRG